MKCQSANISKYVDYHLQLIAKQKALYVKDSRFSKKFGKVKDKPEESLLVILDIKSIYTNIPNNEDKNSWGVLWKMQRNSGIYKSYDNFL